MMRKMILRRVNRNATTAVRSFSISAEHEELMNTEREAMEYDVLIIGAGPA